MGEATYYGKLGFDSPEAAEKALPEVERLLVLIRKAEDDWQKIRDGDRPSWKLRDNELRARNQEVFDLLQIPQPDEDKADAPLNYLSGELDSPFDYDGWEIFRDFVNICFKGLVWHFADWDNMLEKIAQKVGAISHGWVSDEYEPESLYDRISLHLTEVERDRKKA